MEKIRISSKTSIYDLVSKYPKISEIMIKAGFTDITKPMMIQTAGRYMTLEKGSKMKNIDWTVLENLFNESGFLLTKESNDE